MMRALALLLCCWVMWAHEAWSRPHLLTVAPAAREAWRALFTADPGWLEQRLMVIVAAEPERWPLLLVARLLDTGPAWQQRLPRSRSQVGLGPVEAPHLLVRDAILRELRWSPPQPELAPAYRAALARPWPSSQRLALLDLLEAVDPQAAQAAALELADPAITIALPGLRAACQQWLLERQALPTDDRSLVARILVDGTTAERVLLLRSLPPAALAPHFTALFSAGLAALSSGQADGSILLQACCRRLDCADLSQIQAGLLSVLGGGRRAEVTVLAGSLASMDPASIAAPVRQALQAGIEGRIGTSADLTLRHALLAVLAAWDPVAIGPLVGRDDPWRQVGEHRQRLSAP